MTLSFLLTPAIDPCPTVVVLGLDIGGRRACQLGRSPEGARVTDIFLLECRTESSHCFAMVSTGIF